MRWLSVGTAVLVLGCPLAEVRCLAQIAVQALPPPRFDFLDPGARSLGMASAFTAVADDATAAFTNPAGLTFLLRPEVAGELRYGQASTTYLAGGRLAGTPSGVGLDSSAAPVYAASSASSTRPSFLSIVYPHNRWAFSFYRHELVRQSNSFLSQGSFDPSPPAFGYQQGVVGRETPFYGTRDLTVDNYTFAGACRISPRLSVGASVSGYRLSEADQFSDVLLSQGADQSVLGLFSPVADGAPSFELQARRARSTKLAATIGAVVTATPKVRLGIVWKQGASFPLEEGAASANQSVEFISSENQFATPSILAGGLRFTVNDQLILAFDYDRIGYSSLSALYNFFVFSGSGTVTIPDGNDVHVGIEYTLVSLPHTPSLRAGMWLESNHAAQFTPGVMLAPSANPLDAAEQEALNIQALDIASFPAGSSVWHYCFGFGFPLSRAYEVNFGTDLASNQSYASVSVVARFGK
jgi:long-chain fatty acid transport protein